MYNQTTIASGNGLSPGRRQSITWSSAGILLIRPVRTKFSEIIMKIHTFTFNEKHLKMSTAKHWPFCIGLNVLNDISLPSILRTLVLKLQALNKDSHTKDATVSWPSYLCNANPYTWKDILYIETCLSILLSWNLKLASVYLTKTNTNMAQGDRIIHNRKVYVGRPLQRRWAHRWRKSHP